MADNRTGNPEIFNTRGPVPGSNRAISQRKAVSEGYEAAKTPRMVDMQQKQMETGWCDAPGISSPKAAAHDRMNSKKAR